jgi:hypothetical protein
MSESIANSPRLQAFCEGLRGGITGYTHEVLSAVPCRLATDAPLWYLTTLVDRHGGLSYHLIDQHHMALLADRRVSLSAEEYELSETLQADPAYPALVTAEPADPHKRG